MAGDDDVAVSSRLLVQVKEKDTSTPRAKNSPPDCFINALSIPDPARKRKRPPCGDLFLLAGMAGIEPARAESKSAVLPLDYIPIWGG